MKTRALLILALAASAPLALYACSSDDSSQTDGGPQNGKDSGTDTSVGNDSAPQNDSGGDALPGVHQRDRLRQHEGPGLAERRAAAVTSPGGGARSSGRAPQLRRKDLPSW